jgi:hypothetical protein
VDSSAKGALTCNAIETWPKLHTFDTSYEMGTADGVRTLKKGCRLSVAPRVVKLLLQSCLGAEFLKSIDG